LTIADAGEEEKADVGDLHRDARESGVVTVEKSAYVIYRPVDMRSATAALLPQKEDPDHDELCVSGEPRAPGEIGPRSPDFMTSLFPVSSFDASQPVHPAFHLLSLICSIGFSASRGVLPRQLCRTSVASSINAADSSTLHVPRALPSRA
jgi:hypothetical protein